MEEMRGTKRELINELVTLRQRLSELEASKANLSETEEKLQLEREVLQNMAEGVQITRAKDGVIVYANPMFEEMFGYGHDELVGKHVSVLNASDERTPQEVAEEIITDLEAKGVWSGEVHNIKKDGTPFWCRANVSTFEHRAHGRVWVAVHEDITERKQAQESAQHRYHQLSAITRVITRLLQTFDLDERLNSILDELMPLVQAEMGSIWLRSGEELLLRCWKGMPDDVRAQLVARQVQYELPWLREFTVLHEPLSQPGQIPQFAKESGIQALASIPLTIMKPSSSEAEWLGTLMLASRHREALDEDEVAVIRAMSEQLALAIDHSLQFYQARQRLVRLGVLRAVDRGIIGRLSIPEILATVVEGVPCEMGADAIAISLFSPDRAKTQVCLMRLPNGTVIEKEAFTLADSLLHWLVERQEPVIIYDLASDPRLQMHGNLIRKHKLVSYLGVPLGVEGRTTGIMHILTAAPKVFTPEDVEFFQILAGQAAIAIRSAGLYEEAQSSARKYSTLFELASDAILMVVPPEGHIFDTNAAAVRLLGYSKEELCKICGGDIIAPEAAEETGLQWQTQTEKKGRFLLETIWVRKDGSRVPVEVSGKPIELGGQALFQLIARDITERKQAEAKAGELETMKEVDRLRSGLLANVSHELRTPLTSILGFTSTLLRTDATWSADEQRDFLQTIQQESQRLAHLVDDLLDMSRLESGTYRLKKANHDISQLLGETSRRFASLVEHHQLELKMPEKIPQVFIDEDSVWQVLNNMVGNAAKFSPPGSKITIEAWPSGEEVIISVIDRGQGIPTALLDKVFDRFYQADKIVSGQKKGTGLGLPISKGIIEAQGGRIWAESQEGEGSRFSFSLPVSKGE